MEIATDRDQPTKGEGFVMWFDGKPVDPELATRRAKALEELAEIDGPLWPGIADEVKDLERLLKC